MKTNLLLLTIGLLHLCQKTNTTTRNPKFWYAVDGRVWTPNPKFLGGGYAKATLYDYESVDRVDFTKKKSDLQLIV